MIGRLGQISWTVDYLRELEADFLALYRIVDPWSMPARRFFRLALRTPYYQGAMQAKVLAETEGQQGGTRSVGSTAAPEVSPEGVDMRHNMAAAKAAGKGLKEGSNEVSYVPASVFVRMPEVQAEHVTVS